MNKLLLILTIFLLAACTQTVKKTQTQTATQTNVKSDETPGEYGVFDSDRHLCPDFDKAEFESLTGWDFCWAILQPINRAKTAEHERILVTRFSPGQKALYFFWNFDAKVSNTGFVQFYCNNNRHYLPATIKGLELVGDKEMLALVDKVEKEYLANEAAFLNQLKTGDCEPLINELTQFQEFDKEFYMIHDKSIGLIEQYIRAHPDEFVKLR